MSGRKKRCAEQVPYGIRKFESAGKATDRHNREYTAGESRKKSRLGPRGFPCGSLRHPWNFIGAGEPRLLRLLRSPRSSPSRDRGRIHISSWPANAPNVLERLPEGFLTPRE